ncbi:putative phage abortive infection protein [uncultured Tolumonas sp.]|uniref:putative phage abortive infection protein n=1 Tax=uncultured Tolumonas sp. TaxID=263765 RepID=UPI00292D1A19|nr:putative phage abortive infection protein [uncultured Tolumonas sp.]
MNSLKISIILKYLESTLRKYSFLFVFFIVILTPIILWLIKYDYISNDSYLYRTVIYLGFPIEKISNSMPIWGATGDFFGGMLNPIISLFGMIFLIKTYNVTKSQFNSQLKEQEISSYNSEKQTFESTFFSMLGHLSQLESKIKFDDIISRYEVLNFYPDQISDELDVQLSKTKRDIHTIPNLNEYFIFLFRILKFIDQKIPKKRSDVKYSHFIYHIDDKSDRKFYSGHIRALLNPSKLKLLAINCSITDTKPNYEEYHNLITEFSMFEHVNMISQDAYTNILIDSIFNNYEISAWGENIFLQEYLKAKEEQRLSIQSNDI